MYSSTFPSNPATDSYLRAGRIIEPGETGQDMVNRIVSTLAGADARFDPEATGAFAERLGWAMDTARIVFSTPIMTNAGRYADRPLAACAVPPVDLRGDLAQVKTVVDDYHRAGMGTGFNLDDLDDPVGVLWYLNDVAVTGANSGVEDRPVGNMAILSLAHPRAEEFITCKLGADQRGEEWKFNISLHVTDAQMRAAITAAGREREMLVAAAEAAHACADPGLLFADRMNVAGETCQFGYVNLGRFHTASGAVPVDLDTLADTVRTLVRALDDAIEASLAHYPSVVSAQVMGTKRKIGVGVCGLADLLLAAGLPYDSPHGRQLAQEVLAFVNYTSKLASVELATRRGACPAVHTGQSRYADPDFLTRFAALDVRSVTAGDWTALAEEVAETGLLRNSSTIAVPPTGRSAPVVGASTGIEPLFRLTDPRLPGHIHPLARSVLDLAGRTDLLGFVQACVDEAVSKTVNLPGSARAIDVYDTYLSAWELGCKGITVYVDGSRQVQPKAL